MQGLVIIGTFTTIAILTVVTVIKILTANEVLDMQSLCSRPVIDKKEGLMLAFPLSTFSPRQNLVLASDWLVGQALQVSCPHAGTLHLTWSP
jgi:hypothetical protein